MNQRILFLIYKDEIKFTQNPNIDHKEWFHAIGGTDEEYENLIRGFIIDDKMIFVKKDLGYDSEVISVAQRCAPLIKKQLNKPYLKVCCGIQRGMNGSSWEPIMVLKEESVTEEQKELLQRVDHGSSNTSGTIIDFKNNYEDPKFIKYAEKFTLILLIITIIVKVILIGNKTILMSSRWNSLLVYAQIIFLILTLIGYNRKMKNTKYFGIAACIALFFMFDLPDIIIGIINLFFTVDQTYIIDFLDFCHRIKEKIKTKTEHTKKNNKKM